MIKGAKDWNKPRTYYIQTNNPTEEILRKIKEEENNRNGFLESCGPTSAINCLAACGYDLKIRCPGPWEPQPEEILTDFFNDKRNYIKFQEIRNNLDPATIPGNRVPQYYPYAVKQVFNINAKFIWSHNWSLISSQLISGNAVQICLKNPGHYIACVAYDIDKEEIIYNDSWPDRHKDKNGFNRRMGKKEFEENTQSFFIIYLGGENDT